MCYSVKLNTTLDFEYAVFKGKRQTVTGYLTSKVAFLLRMRFTLGKTLKMFTRFLVIINLKKII